MQNKLRRRVLIPSSAPAFCPGLAKAYYNLGYEPITGAMNFHLCLGMYDIVHFLWPEYLCTSFPPSRKEIHDIGKKLEWWRHRSQLIISVQNFYPHCYEFDPAYKKLYNLFYEACSGITHYSRTSLQWVCEEFPVASTKPNIITTPPNFSELVKKDVNRSLLRKDFGLSQKDFVILVFGVIRKLEEARLIRKAYSITKVPHNRLLIG